MGHTFENAVLFLMLLITIWFTNTFFSSDSPAKVSGAEFRQEQDLLFQDRKVGREAWLHNCSTSLACFFIKGTMWFPSLVNFFPFHYLQINIYIYMEKDDSVPMSHIHFI